MAGSDVRAKDYCHRFCRCWSARIRQVQVKTTTGSPRITFTDGNGGTPCLTWTWTLQIHIL